MKLFVFFADVEGLRGIPRAEREEKWQELIQIVEDYIRSAVEYEEECIREREDNRSSGDDESRSTDSERPLDGMPLDGMW